MVRTLKRSSLYTQLQALFNLSHQVPYVPNRLVVEDTLKEMVNLIQGDSGIFYKLDNQKELVVWSFFNISDEILRNYSPFINIIEITRKQMICQKVLK